MQTFIELVFTGLVGAGGALMIVWKGFIDIKITKAIEDHKTELTHESNKHKAALEKEIAEYKAELDERSVSLKTQMSIYAHEQHVGLSRLDAQRSKAIQELFGIIIQWHEVYLELTKRYSLNTINQGELLQSYHFSARSLIKLADQLSIKARDTVIFFNDSSYKKIAKFGMAVSNISIIFYENTFGKNLDYDDHEGSFEIIFEEARKLKKHSESDIDELRDILVSEFRKLMNA